MADSTLTQIENLAAVASAAANTIAVATSQMATLLKTLEPVVTPPPPPPPPPPPTLSGLVVAGDVLQLNGATLPPFCSVEVMLGSTQDVNAAIFTVKALNATALGPLLEGAPTAARVKTVLDATRGAGLLCLLNFDHGGGRAVMKSAAIAAVITLYPHVILQCEVELGDATSDEAWRDGAIAYVQDVAKVLPNTVLRVGLPEGGRNPAPAMHYAAAVRDAYYAAGGKAGVVFAPQAYWSMTTGWYQGESGVAAGIAGTLQMVDKIAVADGVCWGVGTDYMDNVGQTGQAQIEAEALARGLWVQCWALSGDGIGNNLVGDPAKISTITAAGRLVQAAYAKFPRLPAF